MEQKFTIGSTVRVKREGHIGIVKSIYENIRHRFLKVEYTDIVTGEVHKRYFFERDLEEVTKA